jgi:hypothetical protein
VVFFVFHFIESSCAKLARSTHYLEMFHYDDCQYILICCGFIKTHYRSPTIKTHYRSRTIKTHYRSRTIKTHYRARTIKTHYRSRTIKTHYRSRTIKTHYRSRTIKTDSPCYRQDVW